MLGDSPSHLEEAQGDHSRTSVENCNKKPLGLLANFMLFCSDCDGDVARLAGVRFNGEHHGACESKKYRAA